MCLGRMVTLFWGHLARNENLYDIALAPLTEILEHYQSAVPCSDKVSHGSYFLYLPSLHHIAWLGLHHKSRILFQKDCNTEMFNN